MTGQARARPSRAEGRDVGDGIEKLQTDRNGQ
jgi:hypothetical protein